MCTGKRPPSAAASRARAARDADDGLDDSNALEDIEAPEVRFEITCTCTVCYDLFGAF